MCPIAEATADGLGPRQQRLGITADELSLIKNALNEVVNGLVIIDFPRRIGAELDTAQALLRDARAILRGQSARSGAPPPARRRVPIVASVAELRVIHSALTTVVDEIDAAEFATRLGSAPEDARAIAAKLGELWDSPAPSGSPVGAPAASGAAG
jgi:hypothetical protein